ncbi:type II toxin-antitoxin system prevent-host-death family antitoxin [Natranaerofaba carboxydovora]|uniref:type II toxin-antitoxin system prevent-host-death family antitoxin n=1 Tax=Natranaerofaba carboxydovora TaxID=2742683 RepID=UPI001F13347E|nr:type II toxin-antitoxin system prevent-host-death family antitoxin [Natranaerofaba carboxydovora]UMZ74525.1 Antitoxin Phd_YefM, type II toxin-antitoxin system [Natranaerofaba carboxydovora]
MPEIRPMKDLRNTTEISELCHATDEPIYITKNGYGDLVVMSIEAYEKKMAKLGLYEKLAKAEEQAKNGEELLEADDVFRGLRNKHVKK